jgi:hypothetical protein
MRFDRLVTVATSIAFLFSVCVSLAQTNVTGYIGGVVASNEVTAVKGARVTATRPATRTSRTILTAAEGDPNLNYQLPSGFQPPDISGWG